MQTHWYYCVSRVTNCMSALTLTFAANIFKTEIQEKSLYYGTANILFYIKTLVSLKKCFIYKSKKVVSNQAKYLKNVYFINKK